MKKNKDFYLKIAEQTIELINISSPFSGLFLPIFEDVSLEDFRNKIITYWAELFEECGITNEKKLIKIVKEVIKTDKYPSFGLIYQSYLHPELLNEKVESKKMINYINYLNMSNAGEYIQGSMLYNKWIEMHSRFN